MTSKRPPEGSTSAASPDHRRLPEPLPRLAPDDLTAETRAELDSVLLHRAPLHTWRWYDFELSLFDTHRTDGHGKSILAYELHDRRHPGDQPVFRGTDFAASPLHAIDSDTTAAALLSFLGLQEGDVEAEYFASYTPTQLEWRDERATEVVLWRERLEKRAAWRQMHDEGKTQEMVEEIIREGWIADLWETLRMDIFEVYALVNDLDMDASDPHTRRFLGDLLDRYNEGLVGPGVDWDE